MSAADPLIEHLRRIGVPVLPRPNPDAVAAWRQTLSDDDAAAASSSDPTPPTVAATVEQGSTNAVAESRPLPTPPEKREVSPAATGSMFDAAATGYAGPGLPPDQRLTVLERQREIATACVKCETLAQCRTHVVYGEGSPTARFAFFGEAPGADEDRTGRPFVGAAGQLLDKIITACQLKRDDVYILNTVKCRPPGNRNPEPTEVANCRDYFETQFDTVRPEYIVCLGAVASQSLLDNKAAVGKMRGRLHRYRDSKVLVTYHPAYLLRNPKAKAAVWADLKMMLADAGIEV